MHDHVFKVENVPETVFSHSAAPGPAVDNFQHPLRTVRHRNAPQPAAPYA